MLSKEQIGIIRNWVAREKIESIAPIIDNYYLGLFKTPGMQHNLWKNRQERIEDIRNLLVDSLKAVPTNNSVIMPIKQSRRI